MIITFFNYSVFRGKIFKNKTGSDHFQDIGTKLHKLLS